MSNRGLYAGLCIGDKFLVGTAVFITTVAIVTMLMLYLSDNKNLLRWKIATKIDALKENHNKYEKSFNCPKWANYKHYSDSTLKASKKR